MKEERNRKWWSRTSYKQTQDLNDVTIILDTIFLIEVILEDFLGIILVGKGEDWILGIHFF